VNNELERIWKEVAVAKFEVLSQHLPGGFVLYLFIYGLFNDAVSGCLYSIK
jgi:hypothetical protein